MGKSGKKKYNTIFILLAFISIVSCVSIVYISKVQVQYRETYANQIYSTLSRNLDKAEDDLGYIGCAFFDMEHFNTNGCFKFYKKYMQYLPYKKYCLKSKDSTCVPKYTYDKIKSYRCYKLYRQIAEDYKDAIILKNSSIMIIAAERDIRLPVFGIDLNGKFGPNAAGDDLLLFVIKTKANTGATYIELNPLSCPNI